VNQLEDDTGNALVFEIVLAAVVLLAVGTAAYVAMSHKKSIADVSSASPSPSWSAASTPTPAPSTKPANEFDVVQLGFKMTLPSGLAGLTYSVEPPNNTNPGYTVDTVEFSTSSLQAQGCKAGVSGGITKWTKDPRTVGVAGLGQVEQVGSFYLGWDRQGNTSCTGGEALQSSTLLQKAFSSATAVSVLDITPLGVEFALPSDVSDLTYQIVHLTGDQAVNSVEFSSQRLEVAGCGLSAAPLGYLTYDSDKGGTLVASDIRNSSLYYVSPASGVCKANASLQDWQALKSYLTTAVTDQ
jgi:hypothetical protein